MELHGFQKQAIAELLSGKRFIISGMGCLAKGTPVKMADGKIKNVEDVRTGDKLMSFDDESGKIMPNEVASIIRSCDCPKPMIELEYDGERIITTYDHYFYTGDGFAPLYQLIWGALEASQRSELQLLCQQYGQDCDNTFFWKKYSKDNVACKGQIRILQDSNGRENRKSPQNYSGNLVRKSFESTIGEPYRLQPEQQQNRESGMVFSKIQCILWSSQWEHKSSDHTNKPQESIRSSRAGGDKKVLLGQYARYDEPGESPRVQETMQAVQESVKAANCKVRNWSIKIKSATPYYTISMRTAPYSYCIGERHTFITHNSGKTAMAVVWARLKCEKTNKNKVLVVTTASKSRTGDFQEEDETWNGDGKRELIVISWHKLAKWVNENLPEIKNYVVIFDEVQRGSAGVSSGMGKAFLKITKYSNDWAAFTGTPGDTWLKFYPYMQACNLVRNKTTFLNTYASIQTYKGYPEIVSWRNEDELKHKWAQISYAPDTQKVMSELPSQTHKVFTFKKPKGYSKVLKTRYNADGEFLDTAGALCAELRRLCFTADKQQWIKDFVDGLESGCVFFYNFIKTGDMLEEIISKALPKGSKVWRIDGKHHDIPTAETIGPKDMVLCQWQSGSEGLNLQMLHYWVAVELCYSYSTANQARGRIRRIGQKHPQWYGYLLTEGTIEQDILKCLKGKSEFSEANWCISNKIITKEEI